MRTPQPWALPASPTRARDLEALGIGRARFQSALASGRLARVRQGVYVASDHWPPEPRGRFWWFTLNRENRPREPAVTVPANRENRPREPAGTGPTIRVDVICFVRLPDSYWEQANLVGEADGRMKYADPSSFVREMEREQLLRDLGFRVVRWLGKEIHLTPGVVMARIGRELGL